MTRVVVGSASIPGTVARPGDRTALGVHGAIVLGGTPNEHEGGNEADVAWPIADALVSSTEPPTDGEILAALERMDEAVHDWRRAAPDAWGAGLDFVGAFPRAGVVRVVHVGATAVYQLTLPDLAAAPIASRRTDDHTWRAEPPSLAEGVLSSVGAYPIQRIDVVAIPRKTPMRLALVSAGAIAGLRTPLGYLAGVRSAKECAERICAEARQRSGGVHQATAIVMDVDPEVGGPYR